MNQRVVEHHNLHDVSAAGATCEDYCETEELMGIWKAQISIRVRQELRHELEDFAARERRTLGNLGDILVEWAFEQLKAAGSAEQLFHREMPRTRDPGGNYRRKVQ